MRLLFTKADLPGSRLIRWGLEEPVSHVALESDGVVLHSTWGSLDLDAMDTFLDKREIVHSIEVPDYNLYDMLEIANQYEGNSYDFPGLLGFAWAAFRRKFFGTPLPAKNPHNTPGAFLCTEVATLLVWGREDGMITPYELYLALLPYSIEREIDD